MKELLSMFSGNKNADNQNEFSTKVTVLEEGNVRPGQAFKKKERKTTLVDGQEVHDSSDSEEIEEEKLEENSSEVNLRSQQTFIQIMFDSQIKR